MSPNDELLKRPMTSDIGTVHPEQVAHIQDLQLIKSFQKLHVKPEPLERPVSFSTGR